MNKTLLALLTLTFSSVALAESSISQQIEDKQKIENRFDDQRIQSQNLISATSPIAHQVTITPRKSNTLTISKQELSQRPDLVVRAMIPAVTQGNADNVALLYPIYQQIPNQYHDPILTKWAEAILAKQNRNYNQSIKLYRELLSSDASLEAVRFQLAVALFDNGEFEASEDQFKKLRAEVTDPSITSLFDQFLNAISRRDRWTFNGGLTYLNDPNINNAPKNHTTYGQWTAPKPESAEGVGFNLAIGKKWSFPKGLFSELRLNANGKYYWDNKKYNEMSTKGYLGIGIENAYSSLTLLPFIEQTLYAGGSNKSETLKRFSKSSGVALEASYWLTPKWQLNADYEYGEQRYTQRKHLNGNYHFGSIGALYLPTAKTYFFGNVNYNHTSTRDKDDSFSRKGITLGWGQEWSKGFSTRLSISYAQKRYKAPLRPIFEMNQRNNEYSFQATMWHKAIHIWGITPRLTYQYTKTNSNYFLYNYDKQRLFVDFSKQF